MGDKDVCIIIPAYNEEKSIKSVTDSIKKVNRKFHIVIINDGSTDKTREIAEKTRVRVINLPFNLGIGGAVQTGIIYAKAKGFEKAVQLDADGQHDPKYIPWLLKKLKGVDMVIGSRYLKKTGYKTPFVRLLGTKIISELIYLTCAKRIYDPTSGYKAFNKRVIDFFSSHFPQEFPDAVSRVILLKNGYKIKEVPVEMRKRLAGKSSVGWLYSLYLLFSLSISILLASAITKEATNE